MLVIPPTGRLRQEDLKFKIRLGYIDTVSKKKKRKKSWPPVAQACNRSYLGG
jgi:hypothetical protein